MNCEDLIELQDFKGQFWPVAGEKGVKNEISWIYFADTLQCLRDDMDVRDFLNGNELVIMTNTSLTDDEKKVMKVIRAMYEKHISALFINDGQISKSVVDFCNSKGLPLFALSLDIRLLDFSRAVCEKLLDEEKETAAKEKPDYHSLISKVEDKDFLENFVEKNIGSLIYIDRNSDSDLLNTLSCYISHNMSISETADNLFIHRNTLHYRLEKIKKLLNTDLENMDDLVTIKLALSIYEKSNKNKN